MWTFWKTKVKRTNLKFSYFLLVTFWCISCCFWLSAFLLDCGLLNSILKHQIWKWTGRFVKKAKMEKRRWQKFSDFNLCCYFLLSQPCSHHRLETWTKPALPAAFPISVNGNSMLSVAWLKKLVVTLDFFFSHTQYLVYQPILLALFSEYIYPESNHFSPSLSLPPWPMLPSPLTLIPLPTPLHSYPFRSIFNITDKMILLKETKLDHILRWNP